MSTCRPNVWLARVSGITIAVAHTRWGKTLLLQEKRGLTNRPLVSCSQADIKLPVKTCKDSYVAVLEVCKDCDGRHGTLTRGEARESSWRFDASFPSTCASSTLTRYDVRTFASLCPCKHLRFRTTLRCYLMPDCSSPARGQSRLLPGCTAGIDGLCEIPTNARTQK